MMRKLTIIVTLAIGMTTTFPICALGQMDDPDMNIEFYEQQINHIIKCCMSKAKMSSSESKNIRDTGILASKKAKFCKKNKKKLIEEMINIKLAKKDYKVNYFVKSKFFEFEKNSKKLKKY
jgi:hypothetical protein